MAKMRMRATAKALHGMDLQSFLHRLVIPIETHNQYPIKIQKKDIHRTWIKRRNCTYHWSDLKGSNLLLPKHFKKNHQ